MVFLVDTDLVGSPSCMVLCTYSHAWCVRAFSGYSRNSYYIVFLVCDVMGYIVGGLSLWWCVISLDSVGTPTGNNGHLYDFSEGT